MLYMFRNSCRFQTRVPYHLAFLSFIRPDYDKTEPPKYDDTEVLSGTEALKRLYSTTKDGVRPEVRTALNAISISAICGFGYGGYLWSREAFIRFMENNKAAAFVSSKHAQWLLQSKVGHSFIQGGVRWAVKMSFFVAVYVFVFINATVYRGYDSILDYLLAGAVTGAICRLHLGLRGMFAGGVLAMGLSFIYGLVTMGLMKLTGASWHDVQRYNKDVEIWRINYIKEGMKKEMLEDPIAQVAKSQGTVQNMETMFKESTKENVAKAKDEAKK